VTACHAGCYDRALPPRRHPAIGADSESFRCIRNCTTLPLCQLRDTVGKVLCELKTITDKALRLPAEYFATLPHSWEVPRSEDRLQCASDTHTRHARYAPLPPYRQARELAEGQKNAKV
jgi:hypothetical protein